MAKNEAKQTATVLETTRLARWNGWLAALFAIQALLIAILSKGGFWPVQATYQTPDLIASELNGQVVQATAIWHLFDINIAYLLCAALLIMAIMHALTAAIYRRSYEAELKKRMHRLRWVAYSLSGALIGLVIALLTGVREWTTLLLVAALSLMPGLMGLMMETYSAGKDKPNWLAFWIGGGAVLAVFKVLAFSIWSTNVYGSGTTPGYVYWLLGTLAALCAVLAVNVYLQHVRRGRWSDYVYVERVYMGVAAVGSAALTWQIYAGALRP